MGCWAHTRRKFIEAEQSQPKSKQGKGGKIQWQSVGSKSSIVLNKHSKIRRGKSDMLPANQRLSLCSMSSKRG
ncbi:hypothetical protein AB6D66_27130 [Vibrio pomeroyi]|uniref:Transposase IS66 central domain-containing protein n=1 Tax=Vibrio pomeroyi TaxID=198832 RepID=A0ABV4N667_9VIBR